MEEETEGEASPPAIGIKSIITDSTTKQRQVDVAEPIWHDLVDLPTMLKTRTGAHPVGPARTNLVRRSKKTGRRVNGLIIGSRHNSVKKSSGKQLVEID